MAIFLIWAGPRIGADRLVILHRTRVCLDARYIRGMAAKPNAAGWDVFRVLGFSRL